jgi:hypothetical protein
MITKDDGTLWLENALYIGADSKTIEDATVKIGYLEATRAETNIHEVIHAGNNDLEFIVYEDGKMKATGAEFTGTIHATGGTIGGLTIDQLIEGGYTVDIQSSEGGFAFKNGQGSKIFSFKLYRGQENVTALVDRVVWILNKEEIKSSSNPEDFTVEIFGSAIENSAKLTCRVYLKEEE